MSQADQQKGFQRMVVPGLTSRQVWFTISPGERRSTLDIYVGGDSTSELTATFQVHPD